MFAPCSLRRFSIPASPVPYDVQPSPFYLPASFRCAWFRFFRFGGAPGVGARVSLAPYLLFSRCCHSSGINTLYFSPAACHFAYAGVFFIVPALRKAFQQNLHCLLQQQEGLAWYTRHRWRTTTTVGFVETPYLLPLRARARTRTRARRARRQTPRLLQPTRTNILTIANSPTALPHVAVQMQAPFFAPFQFLLPKQTALVLLLILPSFHSILLQTCSFLYRQTDVGSTYPSFSALWDIWTSGWFGRHATFFFTVRGRLPSPLPCDLCRPLKHFLPHTCAYPSNMCLPCIPYFSYPSPTHAVSIP